MLVADRDTLRNIKENNYAGSGISFFVVIVIFILRMLEIGYLKFKWYYFIIIWSLDRFGDLIKGFVFKKNKNMEY